MRRADAKYFELQDLGTWGKRSAKDDQIVALTSKIDKLTKNKNAAANDNKKDKKKDNKDNNVPKWKYDRKLSNSATYKRNEKTYHWCTGPGHEGKGMWVIHDPGSCKGKAGGSNQAQNQGNKPNFFNRQALIGALQQKGSMTAEEIESKVEAILAVFES